MDNVKDVAPEIIEAILKDFEKSMSSPSVVMRQLEEQVKQVGANYSLAYRYAGEINNALTKAIKDNLNADVLPDGNLYYNIAERVFGVTLKRGHDFVTDFAKKVQSSINKENGVGLKPVSAPFNEERAKGIAKYVAYNRLDPTPYDEVIQKKIDDAVENYLLNSVDETIRENAELHSKVGLHAVIKRIVSSSKPCERCQNLQGTYDYEDVRGSGNPVFQRHTRCHCIVLYKSSKDTDWLDVHTKYDSYSDKEVQKRIEYSKAVQTQAERDFRRQKNIARSNGENYVDALDYWCKTKTETGKVIEGNTYVHEGVIYRVDGKHVIFNPSDREKEVAKIITDYFGGDITLYPKVKFPQGIKTSDYFYRAEKYDLTEIEGNAKDIVYNKLKKKKLQANNYVLDITTKTTLSYHEVETQTINLFNRPVAHFVNRVIIVKDDKVLHVFERI